MINSICLHLLWQLSPTDVQKKTIVFQVFDWERFSANDGIGEVSIGANSTIMISSFFI